jgi:soluble lytic murein transglycosylase
MHKRAGLFLLLGVSAAAVAGGTLGRLQLEPPPPMVVKAPPAPAAAAAAVQAAPISNAIAGDISRWNSLRQTDGLPFSSYASFLLSHRDWPGEMALRRTAERQSVEPSSPAEVVRFFTEFPPLTATGHAGQAFALLATGRVDEARAAARAAWTAGVLPEGTEQRLTGAFGAALTSADHDRRLDVLLDSGNTESARRALALASPARRSLYEARLALQARASDARSRTDALGETFAGDPGLLIDKARYLRSTGDPAGARMLLARPRRLTAPPANPERFLETAVELARGAVADRNWSTAYQIASQIDDIFPAGTDVSQRSYAERDEYTNLAWLGGTAAMKAGRPADAIGMFDRYGRAAKSQQTRAKGFFWAAKAAAAAGQAQQSSTWLEQAATSPDQFYGLLAMERLGRTPPPPPAPPSATAEERAAFQQRSLVQAIRHLGMVGNRGDQTLFVRALATSLDNDRDRAIAAEFGRAIGRLDMGVWAAREARAKGDAFYTRAAYPEVPIPPAYRQYWAHAHGIMRQESSFERSSLSPANARGMMQLIPSTAQIEARRLGVPFEVSRLIQDPDYNILLGSAHLARLMGNYGDNLVLTAVAYNAGPGRVPQWIRANGDPRMSGIDVVEWIESIPFSETRNYVQRVIENAMVYDLMNPQGSRSQGRVSYFLGRR